MNNPNIERVEAAAVELKPIIERVVLVGGCATGLLITDAAAPPIRATSDVDVVVATASLNDYYKICDDLQGLGFVSDSDVICRWRKGLLILDFMPADRDILGFANRWYPDAIRTAVGYELEHGNAIKLISAPYFVATKIESFHDRGNGDYLHHDIEDIVAVVDGRQSLCDEIDAMADEQLRVYLREEFDALLSDPTFAEQVAAHLPEGAGRREMLIATLRRIAGL